jgi:hypothetical protein
VLHAVLWFMKKKKKFEIFVKAENFFSYKIQNKCNSWKKKVCPKKTPFRIS